MAEASPLPHVRSPALRRGTACIRCRRRKMKCDSARPVCTPCIEANRIDDCEYSDKQGRTRTEMLEENVALLESRLQELQGDRTPTAPLMLHNPYIASSSAANRPGSLTTPALTIETQMWWDQEELPAQLSETLVLTFIPHSIALGFALDVGRFRKALSLPTPHTERPHKALLNAIYLWGTRLSKNWRQHENLFLQRSISALQDAPGDQAINDPIKAQHRVHTIQAEILLAQHFFCLGLVLEGRYHANAAVALSVSCGLHRIAPSVSLAPSSEIGASALGISLELPAARDAFEMAERIRLFWAVFNVDYCWSVAVDAPCSLSDDSTRGTQIDTPWPNDLDVIQLGLAPLQVDTGGRTVQRFLSEQPDLTEETPNMALRAKASALYGRAANLASRANSKDFDEEEIQKLASIIANFARNLTPLDQLNNNQSDEYMMLAVIHSIMHTSMIYLHTALRYGKPAGESNTSQPCIGHANEILSILEILSSVFSANLEDTTLITHSLDPILAVVSLKAGSVFIEELNITTDGPRTHETYSQEQVLRSSIDRMMSALRSAHLTDMYPIFSQYADKLDEELADDP